jgi:hypothetical protein
MSDSNIVSILFYVVFLSIAGAYAYSAYWGYAIARRFVVRAYRYQAIGIASIGAYFALVNLVGTLVPVGPTSSTLVQILVALVNLSGVPLILVWVDSTARVARRSDPFEKDIFGWSRLRYFVFAVVLVASLLSIVFAPLVPATVSYNSTVSPLLNVIGIFPFLATVVTGAVVLLWSARRSRDRVLHRHIVFFGAFCAAIVLYLVEYSVASFIDPNLYGSIIALIVPIPPFLLGAYFLYRSARSLAPYTSSLENPETVNESRTRLLEMDAPDSS